MNEPATINNDEVDRHMALIDLSLTRHTASGPARTDRVSLLQFARTALATHRERAALRRLDDAALADIGLTRHEALAEAARPFWDVPASWRR